MADVDGKIVLGLDVAQTTDQMNRDLDKVLKNIGKKEIILSPVIDANAKKQLDNIKGKNIDVKVNGDQATKNIQQIEKNIVSTNKQAKTFGDTLKSALNIGSAATIVAQGFRLIRQAAKEAVEAVKDIDAALTQVQIVTGVSDKVLKQFASDAAKVAKEVGTSITEIIKSTETFARLGYSLDESLDLSGLVGKYANVAATTVEDATESLTSIMKAYNYAPSEMERVVDALVKVGQEYAVSAAELGQALQRGGAALEAGGNTIEESIALIAAGNAAVQDASAVGTTLKTVSMRIRSSTAELEAMGETVDDLVKSSSDLRDEIMALSGVDIMLDENTYKSTYEILNEIAKVWDRLNDVQQATLLEDLAGKRNANVVKSVITNLADLEGAYESASNAAGTLATANEVYMDSIEAKSKVLQASFESLAVNTLDSGIIKGIVDATNALVVFLDKTNLVKSALIGLAVGGAIKGITAIAAGFTKATMQINQFNSAMNLLKVGNLGEAQFKQLVQLTGQLSNAQLKAVISSKALTTEQRIAILTASGLTQEEAQQTLATMGLVTAEGAATTATFSLSGAFKALGVAIAANPIGFLVVALTTAISVISTVNRKMEEARQEIIDTGNEAAEHASNIIDLANSYFALADAVDAGTAAKEDMLAAQNDIIKALGLEGKSVDELIAKYGDLQTAIKTITLEQLDTDISQAIKGAKTAKKDSISDLETYLGTSAITSNKETEKAIIKWLYDQGLTTSDSIVSLPHSDVWDAFSDPSFKDLKENRDFLEQAMNAVRKEFGSDNDVFNALSKAYDNYADALDPAVKAIDNANKLIAQYYVAAARGIDDPKTQKEFEQFRQNIIKKLDDDLDFDSNGTFTAEGLVDSILQGDRLYSQFYQEIEDALETVETKTLSHSKKIKDTLSNLWNAEGFEDTKKSILELAYSLDGITADNINDLASSSGELAALLEQDGMSARFLAHILQTEAMGGDGFALITDDALTLNEALEGLRGRFNEVTEAKSRYDAAMKAPEKDTDFKSYAEAFKELNEQFVAGTTNSKAFWAAAEFLFGADQLQEWGWADGLDEIYAAMQKNVGVFRDADSAGAGFLDRLYAISEAGEIKAEDGSVIAEIQKLSDGSYDFQFDSGNLDLLADKLGITSEAALACMQALSMYGDFNFYDVDAVMKAVEEIGLASNSLNGTAVNVGTLTDQLISLGYTNKEIYDLLNVLREVDGVTLLDANANVETLTQSLSDLGLAAQDGVEVTINADGLAELMSQLNFTKEDTQGLIKKLGEADGITLTNAQGEVIDLNTALEHTDELEFASVTSELDGITDSADLAQKAVDELQKSINTLKGKTVTVTVNIQRKNGILGGIFGYAKGTKDAPEGDALVGEEGEELVQSGNRAYLVGTNGPEITHLNEGDIVYTAEQTKKIKRGSTVVKGIVPAYAGGRLNTNKGYTSVLPDSKSSNSTSAKTTTKQIKDAADATANLEEQLEETLKKMKESIDDMIGDFEHQIFLMEKNGKSASEIVSVYKQMQEAVHNQAEEYRKLGLDENSDYIQDLQKQWWNYSDSIKDVIINAYDDIVGELENFVTLTENWLDNAIADSDYGAIVKYTSDIVDYYRQMQDAIHQQAEYYRSLGYSDTSDEVSKLSDLWWDYYGAIAETSANAWKQVVDNANDAVDEITGLYDTLKDAAQEYADSGFITIDTLQEICSWGIQYLAYLKDENGQLVINEESLQRVIAARTEQMAVETALSYVQQIRSAIERNEINELMNLTLATETTTSATWDLVYAQLKLLNVSGDLNDTMYAGALQNINNLRALSGIAISSIGKVEGSVKEANDSAKKALKEQGDYLDDLLKYVMEMIKQEVKNQIEALENQVDKMKDIVDLQKKSLELEREKDNYTKNVAEKTKELAKLQQQLALLELDDSRESAAKQTKLKEEIADLSNDLADDQADHAYDATSDMLDDMFDAYEKEKKKEIEVLENTISSEEKVYRLAIERIQTQWDTLYQQLLDWNYEYGTVTNNEITAAWDAACAAVQKYGSYLEAVLQTQQQLAALEASSSSSSTVIGGGLGTTGTPNIIGNTGNYDTSGKDTFAQANTIVEKMKQNSANWHSGDKTALHNDNRNLAKQLETLLGWPIDFDEKSGTWYMRGKKLYDQFPIYHNGGIVGDDPALKQDEVFAKLKKGETVFTEEQKKPVYQALDFAETMLGKYGKVLSSISGSDLMGIRMQEQIKQDTQQAQTVVQNGGMSNEFNLTFPVQVLQKLSDNEIKDLTKKISNFTIKELDGVFALRGKRSFRY